MLRCAMSARTSVCTHEIAEGGDKKKKKRRSQTDTEWAQSRDSNGTHYFKMEQAFHQIPLQAQFRKTAPPGAKDGQGNVGQDSRLEPSAASGLQGGKSPDWSWTNYRGWVWHLQLHTGLNSKLIASHNNNGAFCITRNILSFAGFVV